MKLLRIACLIAATEVLVLIGFEAAPLSMTKQLSSQVLTKLNTMKRSVVEDTAAATAATANDSIHDYVDTVFRLRTTEWKPNKCKGSYNCGSVSPHHCSGSRVKMFCAKSEVVDIVSGCEMNFTVYMGKGGKAEGADLTMYKKTELDIEGVTYYAFIVYRIGPRLYDSVSERAINCECSGWQTFHIKESVVKTLKPEQSHLELILAVFKYYDHNNTVRPMRCEELKNTFYLDSRTDFDFGMTGSSFQKRNVDTNELPTELSTNMGANGQDKATNSTTASQTEPPTTADNERTDNQEETTQPASPEVTDNASISKETTEPVPTNIPTTVEEIQTTEMTFNPSSFLPLVTLFVVGEESQFKLPSTTITPQTTKKPKTISS